MEFNRNSPMRKNIKLSKTAKAVIFKNTETERKNYNQNGIFLKIKKLKNLGRKKLDKNEDKNENQQKND